MCISTCTPHSHSKANYTTPIITILTFSIPCRSAFLVAIPTITSLPPPQVPMSAPGQPDQQLFTSDYSQGDDIQPVLRNIASGLNQGYPDGWERFTRAPVSSGSSNIQMVTADNLKSVMQTWGLDGSALDQAYDRVHMAIELAVSEAVYFAQGFSYNWKPCQGGGDHPACLATLMVVVKVPDAIGDDGTWKAEVGHIYISTAAETLQQWVPWHRCHNCWFKRCCHDGADPRNLDTEELEVVKTVMSTFQANWALNHLPTPQQRYLQPELTFLFPQPCTLLRLLFGLASSTTYCGSSSATRWRTVM